jgi:hypothetical protein
MEQRSCERFQVFGKDDFQPTRHQIVRERLEGERKINEADRRWQLSTSILPNPHYEVEGPAMILKSGIKYNPIVDCSHEAAI